MVDGWRHFHGDASEWTWLGNRGNGFRPDHAFVSPALLGRLKAVEYSHTERNSRISDHSMAIIELSAGAI